MRLVNQAQAAAYVQDAVDSGDPFLIVLALKEIGTARRIPVVLDENPPLSELLRALDALGLHLCVVGTPDGSSGRQ